MEHTYPQVIAAKTYPEICGEYFEGCVVHHLDENPHNNSPYNLRVLSRAEHVEYHREKITEACKKIDKHNTYNGCAKTTLVYTTEFEVIGCYDTAGEAAKAIGCSVQNVYNCCKGKYKTCKGFYYEYL